MADISAMLKSSESTKTTNTLINKSGGDEFANKVSAAETGPKVASREPVFVDDSQKLNSESERKALIDEVKENLEKLNQYIPVTSTNLKFEFDENGEPPIIKVYDKESEKVIREIPSEEFREVAKALEEFADKLTNKGLLFNQTA